jgi:hypothetical protein
MNITPAYACILNKGYIDPDGHCIEDKVMDDISLYSMNVQKTTNKLLVRGVVG